MKQAPLVKKRKAKSLPELRPTSRHTWFALVPVLPQLIIIAVCFGLYYAMIKFYLFFEYGIYIYYALKIIIAFEVLSGARRSLLVPLLAVGTGCAILFTNSVYLTTLASKETGGELLVLGLLGLLITCFVKSRHSWRR